MCAADVHRLPRSHWEYLEQGFATNWAEEECLPI